MQILKHRSNGTSELIFCHESAAGLSGCYFCIATNRAEVGTGFCFFDNEVIDERGVIVVGISATVIVLSHYKEELG